MSRQPFTTRTIRLIGAQQRDTAISLLQNLPLDPVKPLVVEIKEEKKARSLDQNALMWSGPLRDIENQCWVDGRQFKAEIWHEYFKAEFLPEQYDPELCKKEDYQKWVVGPGGSRVLSGSTTDLTKRGFSEYMEQIYAFGANHGTQFSAKTYLGES